MNTQTEKTAETLDTLQEKYALLEDKIVKQKQEADEYQKKLEHDLCEAQNYIRQLEEQAVKNREEALQYQHKLEHDLCEAQDNIRQLEEQAAKNREEALQYQTKLEQDIEQLRKEITVLSGAAGQDSSAELAQAKEYIQHLEKDIGDLNGAIGELREMNHEAENKLMKSAAESVEFKDRWFQLLERQQDIELKYASVCNELEELRAEYQKVMESSAYRMSKSIRTLKKTMAGENKE